MIVPYFRIDDDSSPVFEYAELMNEQPAGARTAMKPNEVKVSLNASTGEYNMEAGSGASEALQDAVTQALIAKMTDLCTCGKAEDEKKKGVEDQKRISEQVSKACEEARQTKQKAKKMVDDAAQEAKKGEDDGKAKLRDFEAQIKEEEGRLKKMEEEAKNKAVAAEKEVGETLKKASKVSDQ